MLPKLKLLGTANGTEELTPSFLAKASIDAARSCCAKLHDSPTVASNSSMKATLRKESDHLAT